MVRLIECGDRSEIIPNTSSSVGFPIQQYGPAKQARNSLEKHSAGKNIALFITHAAAEDEEELQEWLASCKAAAAGAKLIGVFNCRGELNQKIAEFMLSSGDHKLVAYAERRSETVGQPDAIRLDRARVFARETV